MRIWLINTNETLPTDNANTRLTRMGLIAEELADRGHDVLWWHSTFYHTERRQRQRGGAEIALRPNYRVRFLPSSGYRNSISIRRLWNNRQLAGGFAREAPKRTPPDLILSSYPLVELSYEAVRYGERHAVPVVVDLRDMWPEMFLFHVPAWARGAGRIALAPLFRKARYTCGRAHALTGHTAEFVRWGLELGGRPRSPRDRDFPHGYPKLVIGEAQRRQAAEFWRRHGLAEENRVPVVCYLGVIGHVLELEAVVQAARELSRERNVRFVFCGAGSKLDALRKSTLGLPNVVLPGWVGAPEIEWLLRHATAGLAPWKPTPDYEATISNKVIEYWSAGVPVLTSLRRGVLADVISERDCGASYGGDAARLRATICSLVDNPERQQAMSRSARRLFVERFAAEKVYREMVDHLEFIAADRAACTIPARAA